MPSSVNREVQMPEAHEQTESGDAPCCPQCGYIMLGLEQPRCPECGATFTWDQAHTLTTRPAIAFERRNGWSKFAGLLLTWVQVLAVPWIFARQANRRVCLRHAGAFLAFCLLGPAISCIWWEWQLNLAWTLTALVYIVVQTHLLAVLERWPGGLTQAWVSRLPGQTGRRFWLAISCYTSAVMLTELHYGPPLLQLRDLFGVFWKSQRTLVFGELFSWSTQSAIQWSQLALWCLAIGLVFATRIGRPAMPLARRLLLGGAISVVVLVLYATIVEHVGGNLYRWIDEVF